MHLIKKVMLGSVLIATACSASAGISLGKTRIIYNENEKEAAVEIHSKENGGGVFLIQSWVENWRPGDETGNPRLTNLKDPTATPFTLTPPLFMLNDDSSNNIRAIYTGKSKPPADRESIYWFNSKAIPQTEKNRTGNNLDIVIQQRIKLIYRPAALREESMKKGFAPWKQVTVSRENGYIVMSNPSAFYVSVARMTSGGSDIKEAVTIPPKGTVRIKTSLQGRIDWSAINDYGAVTDVMTVAG